MIWGPSDADDSSSIHLEHEHGAATGCSGYVHAEKLFHDHMLTMLPEHRHCQPFSVSASADRVVLIQFFIDRVI